MASNLSNTQSAVIPHNHPISDITNLSTQLWNKQDKLEAWSNISIWSDWKTISAIDTKYSAWANISIDSDNKINAIDTKYDNATQTVAWLMSANDKKKLDGIEEWAWVAKVTWVKWDAETNYREWNVNITKSNIWLWNVDNTSDANKPISTVTQAALDLKQNIADMPTKLTDFTNDWDWTNPFITKAVNDLTNYYTKTQTYTKSEVNTLISNFGWFEVVATLPTSDIKSNVIYLLWPIWTGADKYQEYIYYNSTWTLIGETTVDLTNYATKTEVEQALGNKLDKPTNQDQWTVWQVLKKTANGSEWWDAPATWVISSNNTYEDMVHLSQAEYEALETKDPNTFYSTPDDESWAFEPENTGNTWDKLEKTATGYQWVDGELVKITEGADDYSAMQWPAPEWFHIPLSTEWQWVKTIMNWLGLTTWDKYRINLHLPLSWVLSWTNWNISSRWTLWRYWCSNNYYATARIITMTSSSFVVDTSSQMSWYNIRPFKDLFVVPNNTWTVIQWTLWSAWIFRDETNWLISITWDGTTWYTIADKNLWATVVYKDWDTLSESNCWKFYQRWNNYWFPFTWATTKSTTKVDASWYWPWNYYSSSTFIYSTGDDWNWSSVQNDNLRWWVTWIIPWYVDKYAWWEKINEVPTDWAVWQVLTKTNDGYEFKNSDYLDSPFYKLLTWNWTTLYTDTSTIPTTAGTWQIWSYRYIQNYKIYKIEIYYEGNIVLEYIMFAYPNMSQKDCNYVVNTWTFDGSQNPLLWLMVGCWVWYSSGKTFFQKQRTAYKLKNWTYWWGAVKEIIYWIN